MKVRLLFLCSFLCLPMDLRGAEVPEPTLPPVFVTSTRTETPLQQVTTSASVVTTKDIQDQQAELVLETLRRVPGVDVVQSGSADARCAVSNAVVARVVLRRKRLREND